MSVSDDHRRALRWLQTASEDLDAAKVLEAASKHAHACFAAQQCGEKAVKAAWYAVGQDPWGHSIQALVRDFPLRTEAPGWLGWAAPAATLDRFYIPTRYPDGLPDLTPGEAYFPEDAGRAMELAAAFLEETQRWLDSRVAPRPSEND